ncbi:MAG: hypothetical protein K8R25_11565 [Methanosarcinales archaeon]|nr:hypothetical protein [Methanosarcinales archaeon]
MFTSFTFSNPPFLWNVGEQNPTEGRILFSRHELFGHAISVYFDFGPCVPILFTDDYIIQILKTSVNKRVNIEV